MIHEYDESPLQSKLADIIIYVHAERYHKPKLGIVFCVSIIM